MAAAQSCGHRHVMIAGSVYRTITDQCWDGPRRVADMARMGIAHQVVSPMPELLSYWLPAADAQVLLRDINEQMAQEKRIPYRVAVYGYKLVNRAIAMRATDGFVKLLTTDDDDMRILGMRALGAHASTMIEAVSCRSRPARSCPRTSRR